MVSNQQKLNKVGINEFFSAFRSLGVKKDDKNGEPVKIKYNDVALYRTYHRYSTTTIYIDKKGFNNREKVCLQSHKHQVHKNKKTLFSSLPREGKSYVDKQPGRKPNIFMFIYLLIKLLLTIIIYFIYLF